MNAKVGSSHNSQSGTLVATFCGSIAAMMPTKVHTTRHNAVQPYQYMAGPSPLLPASHPQPKRLVAGWKVNSGKLNRSQTTYMIGMAIAKPMANALNLAETAKDERCAAADCVAVLVVVLVMTRSP